VQSHALEETLTRDIISQVEEVDHSGGGLREANAQLANRGKNEQCKKRTAHTDTKLW
jgi:hypothetical protein